MIKKHLSVLFRITLAMMAVLTVAVSCDTKRKLVQPKISISQLVAEQTSVRFKLTPSDAANYEWVIMYGEDVVASEQIEGSVEKTVVYENLEPATEYIVRATAYNEGGEAVAEESFVTKEKEEEPLPEPEVEITNVQADHDALTFDLSTSEATKVYWAVYEGTDVPENLEYTEAVAQQLMTCTKDNLNAETEYTVTAFAANGEVFSDTVSVVAVTAKAPVENEYLTVVTAAGAKSVYIGIKCADLGGKKYYCNVFSPKTAIWDYDTNSEYFVDSKENFLRYVKSQKNYLSWATLYGDTDKSLWTEYDSEWNNLTPQTEYFVYAIVFTESGDDVAFEETSILEAVVTTAESDNIGDGSASLGFTVEPESDYAQVSFDAPESIAAYAYGYVRKSDADEKGGIDEYVKDKFVAGSILFRDMGDFESTRTERPLSPDTDYYYYTLCYGTDGKLGGIVSKEFRTKSIEFSPDYTCEIVLEKMLETEVKFRMNSDNCTKGRWCNISKEEFDSTYSGDVRKVAGDKLLSDRAEQIFTDSAVYVYSLEKGKDYVFVVLPMGGDMGTVYGTPEMMEYTFE